jgi:2-methylcitrate dehydratase PrpD
MADVTQQLASYVSGSQWSDLPKQVQHEAVRAFVNWVGCAIGGSTHPAVDSALAAVSEISGPAQATVLARGKRLDMVHAALLNGLSASAYAFDDTHLAAIAHPTAASAAALLALAETRPMRGTDFLLALILANEIQCRLASALAVPPGRCHVGLYMTGLTGGIGVAAAVGKLLHLDEQRLVWAMGIGAAQGGGFRATHASMCSGYVPAHAGRNGLLAGLLAAKDFTCTENALDARNGFLDVFGAPANLAALTGRLGEHYECMNVAAKPYPAGCFIHPSIEACLELAHLDGVQSDQIERLDLKVHKLALGLTGKSEPQHGYDAQVSVYHWAAAVLTHRAAGLRETSDECVRDPGVIALRKRVKATVDESLGPDEAKAALTLRNGRMLHAHIKHCLGSAARPMSDAELEKKFVQQAEAIIPPGHARTLVEQCWNLPSAEDVSRAAPGTWRAL